jgi:hypothetical protein
MGPSGSGSADKMICPAHAPQGISKNRVRGIGSVGSVRLERKGTRGGIRPPRGGINWIGGFTPGHEWIRTANRSPEMGTTSVFFDTRFSCAGLEYLSTLSQILIPKNRVIG